MSVKFENGLGRAPVDVAASSAASIPGAAADSMPRRQPFLAENPSRDPTRRRSNRPSAEERSPTTTTATRTLRRQAVSESAGPSSPDEVMASPSAEVEVEMDRRRGPDDDGGRDSATKPLTNGTRRRGQHPRQPPRAPATSRELSDADDDDSDTERSPAPRLGGDGRTTSSPADAAKKRRRRFGPPPALKRKRTDGVRTDDDDDDDDVVVGGTVGMTGLAVAGNGVPRRTRRHSSSSTGSSCRASSPEEDRDNPLKGVVPPDMIICSWCQNVGSKKFNLQTPSSGERSFCSELCFNQYRRASFKKSKLCDWCKDARGTINYVDYPDGGSKLQFCSDSCLNQYKMNIFCKETQAHLELLPNFPELLKHCSSLANNNNNHIANGVRVKADPNESSKITPELWLHCGSVSEHGTATGAEDVQEKIGAHGGVGPEGPTEVLNGASGLVRHPNGLKGRRSHHKLQHGYDNRQQTRRAYNGCLAAEDHSPKLPPATTTIAYGSSPRFAAADSVTSGVGRNRKVRRMVSLSPASSASLSPVHQTALGNGGHLDQQQIRQRPTSTGPQGHFHVTGAGHGNAGLDITSMSANHHDEKPSFVRGLFLPGSLSNIDQYYATSLLGASQLPLPMPATSNQILLPQSFLSTLPVVGSHSAGTLLGDTRVVSSSIGHIKMATSVNGGPHVAPLGQPHQQPLNLTKALTPTASHMRVNSCDGVNRNRAGDSPDNRFHRAVGGEKRDGLRFENRGCSPVDFGADPDPTLNGVEIESNAARPAAVGDAERHLPANISATNLPSSETAPWLRACLDRVLETLKPSVSIMVPVPIVVPVPVPIPIFLPMSQMRSLNSKGSEDDDKSDEGTRSLRNDAHVEESEQSALPPNDVQPTSGKPKEGRSSEQPDGGSCRGSALDLSVQQRSSVSRSNEL